MRLLPFLTGPLVGCALALAPQSTLAQSPLNKTFNRVANPPPPPVINKTIDGLDDAATKTKKQIDDQLNWNKADPTKTAPKVDVPKDATAELRNNILGAQAHGERNRARTLQEIRAKNVAEKEAKDAAREEARKKNPIIHSGSGLKNPPPKITPKLNDAATKPRPIRKDFNKSSKLDDGDNGGPPGGNGGSGSTNDGPKPPDHFTP